jgi:hypothetical protein
MMEVRPGEAASLGSLFEEYQPLRRDTPKGNTDNLLFNTRVALTFPAVALTQTRASYQSACTGALLTAHTVVNSICVLPKNSCSHGYDTN